MSLFGSLYTSVSGLSAQSQATAIISNNIANVNTTGFKRSEAAFASLVTTGASAAHYCPGSVRTHRLQQTDKQGQIQQTGSGTDVAISGEGFFAVRSENSLDQVGDFKWTRNGQFFEDEEGVLQNSAGMFLYGWEVDPLDADPNTSQDVTVYNPDVSALVPVNVSVPSGQARLTTEGTMALNLDADEPSIAVNNLNGLVDFPSQIDYSRTLRTYDSLGSAQDITFEYVKVFGPQASVQSSTSDLELDDLLVNDLGLADTETFTLRVGPGATETFTVTPTSTLNDVIEFVNNYTPGAGSNGADAYLDSEGRIVITGVDFADDIELQNTGGTPLDTLGISTGVVTPFGTLPGDNTTITPPFTDTVFPQTVNQPGSGQYNPRGWWQVNVIGSNPAVPLTQGLINFNSNGSLNAQTDLDGNQDIELRQIDWGNGSDLQDIKINIDGFTQYAGLYNVSVANQNGSELGLRTGVEIDSEGFVNARFSNGTLSRLYKLPIVTFPSPTNLQEISSTSYVESAESGSPLLQEAGVSLAGTLEGAAIERSNVDLADEFTKLIVTQRAYSANTRVITTVDQMTEDLLRLR